MTALLVAIGWKVLAAFAAAAAVVVAWFCSLAKSKASGVAQQQAADTRQKEAELVQANQAGSSVAALDDSDVVRELHRAYDRKPVRLDEGDNRRAAGSTDR